jgi:hypothetical protein
MPSVTGCKLGKLFKKTANIQKKLLEKAEFWTSTLILNISKQLLFALKEMLAIQCCMIWSKSYITPVFKKGAPTAPSNYRSIALTCVMWLIESS